MVSSPLVSMKRPRGSNHGAQPVSCLVDGCYADLSNCRGYHRRHKVCELHSKTPGVTIAGHRQRFCQQCSRFHSLEEFEEGKRSCRKRLEGHNRRRRKPQPDPLIRPVKCLLNYQGSRLSPFPISNVYPSTALGRDPAWVRVNSPSNAEAALYNEIESHKQMPLLGMQSLLPVSVSPYGGEAGKQFSLLQGHQTTPEASSVSQALHHRAIAISSEIRRSEGSGNMFPDGLLTLQVQESDCALSLLSSSQMQTPRIGMVKLLIPSSRLIDDQGLVMVNSILGSSHIGPNGSPGNETT